MTPATMIRITSDRAEVLEPQGWRSLDSLEWIEMPGGNFLQINAESYWTGAVHGFAIGVLVCLGTIGILAAVIAAA